MVICSTDPDQSLHSPLCGRRRSPNSRFFLPLLVFATGCGNGLTGISGAVMIDGKPAMEGVRVVFTPLGDTKQASGTVDEAGQFVLKTGQRPGVMPGEYRVLLINSTASIPQPDTPIEPGVNTPPPEWIAYDRKLTAFLQRPPTGEGWIPVQYGSIADSPLRFQVPGDGTEPTFEVSSNFADRAGRDKELNER